MTFNKKGEWTMEEVDDEKCERCLRGGGELEPGPGSDAGPTYEIRECSELGRYLVAARDIAAGELVFRAAPIVSGLQSGSVPLCLGCYRPLQPPTRLGEEQFCCPTCGWPLCSEDCVLSLRHQPECEATARSGVRVHIRDPERPDALYDCVILIRCLMLRRQSPAHWAQLAAMEAHESKRRPPLQRRRARALCALLKSRFGVEAEESEMLRLLAVLEVNAYEVRMPATNVQAVYPIASLPEHSCIPNTFRTFERDLSVCVRAAMPIPRGHHITVTYTDTLWGTLDRRANLYFSKHFLCACERCADPYELGTCLAALT
ncbi:hypothetical protein B566_EDAN015154 [Ephemera danica]|nr:hypothetical protein B566_EDAN015154 [Ephemera danica]